MALYLLKDNPIEVLRRLAVICLEDAVLPPAYPALVSDTFCKQCERLPDNMFFPHEHSRPQRMWQTPAGVAHGGIIQRLHPVPRPCEPGPHNRAAGVWSMQHVCFMLSR